MSNSSNPRRFQRVNSTERCSVVAMQIGVIKREQRLLRQDLKLLRDEVRGTFNGISKQLLQLESAIAHRKSSGGRQEDRCKLATFSTGGCEAASREKERGFSSTFHRSLPGSQYTQGRAERDIALALKEKTSDQDLIRRCCSLEPVKLLAMAPSTQKNLFLRFITLAEDGKFLGQILPWFQTAINFRMLTKVLSTPGTYSRACTCFSKLMRGSSLLCSDAGKIYRVLTSTENTC